MKKLLVVVMMLVALVLAGCGHDILEGTVVDKSKTEAYSYIMPIQSGNPLFMSLIMCQPIIIYTLRVWTRMGKTLWRNFRFLKIVTRLIELGIILFTKRSKVIKTDVVRYGLEVLR